MSIGSAAVVDDFNRANESPLSGGGNWTTVGNVLSISSNKVQKVTQNAESTWITSRGPDVEVGITPLTHDAGNNKSAYTVFALVASSALVLSNTNNDGYFFRINFNIGDPTGLSTGSETCAYGRVGGANPWSKTINLFVGGTLRTTNWTFGTDRMVLRVVGDWVQAWVTMGGKWFRCGASNDRTEQSGTRLTSGMAGVSLATEVGQAPGTITFDDFRYGNVSPTDPALLTSGEWNGDTINGALPDPISDVVIPDFERNGLYQSHPLAMPDPIAAMVMQHPGSTAHNPNTVMEVGGVSVRRKAG